MNTTIEEHPSVVTLVYNEPKVALPIFATENFLKSKSSTYGWFVSNRFVLPFVIEKKLTFKRLIFTTETFYLEKNLPIEAEKAFLNEVVEHCRREDVCDFIFKAQSNVVFKTFPDNAEVVAWGTYEIALSSTEEELFNNFESKARTKVRKAIKTDVTISTTDDVTIIYQNMKETFLRQQSLLYPSLEYLKKLKSNLKDNLQCFVAEQNGTIQGVALIVYDQERAYYLFGGSTARPSPGSLNLLHYEIIKFCKQKEIGFYDFVGARVCFEKDSKFASLQTFKKSFGAKLKEGYAFRVILKPVKYQLFKRLVDLYFASKGSSYTDPIDSIRRCHEQHTNNT